MRYYLLFLVFVLPLAHAVLENEDTTQMPSDPSVFDSDITPTLAEVKHHCSNGGCPMNKVTDVLANAKDTDIKELSQELKNDVGAYLAMDGINMNNQNVAEALLKDSIENKKALLNRYVKDVYKADTATLTKDVKFEKGNPPTLQGKGAKVKLNEQLGKIEAAEGQLAVTKKGTPTAVTVTDSSAEVECTEDGLNIGDKTLKVPAQSSVTEVKLEKSGDKYAVALNKKKAFEGALTDMEITDSGLRIPEPADGSSVPETGITDMKDAKGLEIGFYGNNMVVQADKIEYEYAKYTGFTLTKTSSSTETITDTIEGKLNDGTSTRGELKGKGKIVVSEKNNVKTVSNFEGAMDIKGVVISSGKGTNPSLVLNTDKIEGTDLDVKGRVLDIDYTLETFSGQIQNGIISPRKGAVMNLAVGEKKLTSTGGESVGFGAGCTVSMCLERQTYDAALMPAGYETWSVSMPSGSQKVTLAGFAPRTYTYENNNWKESLDSGQSKLDPNKMQKLDTGDTFHTINERGYYSSEDEVLAYLDAARQNYAMGDEAYNALKEQAIKQVRDPKSNKIFEIKQGEFYMKSGVLAGVMKENYKFEADWTAGFDRDKNIDANLQKGVDNTQNLLDEMYGGGSANINTGEPKKANEMLGTYFAKEADGTITITPKSQDASTPAFVKIVEAKKPAKKTLYEESILPGSEEYPYPDDFAESPAEKGEEIPKKKIEVKKETSTEKNPIKRREGDTAENKETSTKTSSVPSASPPTMTAAEHNTIFQLQSNEKKKSYLNALPIGTIVAVQEKVQPWGAIVSHKEIRFYERQKDGSWAQIIDSKVDTQSTLQTNQVVDKQPAIHTVPSKTSFEMKKKLSEGLK